MIPQRKAIFEKAPRLRGGSFLEEPPEAEMQTQLLVPGAASLLDPKEEGPTMSELGSPEDEERDTQSSPPVHGGAPSSGRGIQSLDDVSTAQVLQGASMTTLLHLQDLISRTLRERYEQTLAVLFSDIAGSSEYFEQAGDSAGRLMLLRHQELVSPLVSRHSGRVVKTIGDGILAVFPSGPRAVAAAIQMQRAVLQRNQLLPEGERFHIRIGMSFGPTLVNDRDADVFGDTVNLAARVQSQAKASQILITESVRHEVAAGLAVRDGGTVTLRGRSKPQHLYEVLWDDPLNSVPRRRTTELETATPGQLHPLPSEPLSDALAPAHTWQRRVAHWWRMLRVGKREMRRG